jgi:hypothetical protein
MTTKKTDQETLSQDEKVILKWRMASKPTREDVVQLLDKEIITKDEARQMLFNESTESDRVKTLEDQIEFLRGVVDKLSSQPPREVIRYIQNYPQAHWTTTLLGHGYVTTSALVGNSTMLALGGATSGRLGSTSLVNQSILK